LFIIFYFFVLTFFDGVFTMDANDCGLAIGLALIARQAHKPKPNMVTEDEDNN